MITYTATHTDCYATEEHVIDAIDPTTGLTVCFGKTAEDIARESPSAVRMAIEEFCARKAKRQHTPITWSETTEGRFEDMLNVLPPAFMGSGGFLVGEPWDHDAGNGQPRYEAYRKRGDCFEVANRPMTRAEFRQHVTQG